MYYDFIAHWVEDPGNAKLATLTVFTEGRTPEETCNEILNHVLCSGTDHNNPSVN